MPVIGTQEHGGKCNRLRRYGVDGIRNAEYLVHIDIRQDRTGPLGEQEIKSGSGQVAWLEERVWMA